MLYLAVCDFVLSKNNLVLSAADDVRQICSPLKQYFDIDTFSYVKIAPDMSRIHLDTNPVWNEFFYRNISNYMNNEELTEGFHWESGYSTLYATDDPCIPDANQHGMGDGIVISNNIDGYTELCFFASEFDDTRKITVLLQNLDLLYNFIYYFREQASKLIEQANKDPIILPYENIDITKKSFTNIINRKEFLESVSVVKNKLTNRELQCIYYLAEGMSAKQIADMLAISQKTVQRHFENSRNKLNVRKTAALIKLVETYNGLRGNNNGN